jgi:hypothetical protein
MMTQKFEYLSSYKKLRLDALERIVDVCTRLGKPHDEINDSFSIKIDWTKLNKLLDEDRTYYDEYKRWNYICSEGGKASFNKDKAGGSNASCVNDNILFAVCDYLNSKRGA